jgi:hypothetical protein
MRYQLPVDNPVNEEGKFYSFVEQFADRLQGFGMIHSTAFADNEEKRQNRRRSVTFMKEHGTRLLM